MVSAGRAGGTKFGRSAGDSAGHSFGLSFGRVATGLLTGYAALKVKDVLLDSINIASDVSESTNKVRQIFGSATKDILQFSATANTTLGQSVVQARDATSQFGIFGKAAGLSGKDLSGFSIQMDTLAGDLASFNNTTPEQAIEAIGAALRGESEPIRAYGVLLDDASLRQEAMKLGLIDTTKNALTPQQRVLAAHALILKQTSDAQGDFARTSGGLANQQRILSASWENAKGKLGRGLLPIVTEAVHFINQKGIPAFNDFADKFNEKGVPAIKNFVEKAKPLAHELLPAVSSALGTVKDVLEKAAPLAKDLVGAFNDMPDWAKKAVVTGGLAAYAGHKLGVGSLLTGGKGGGGGLLGAVASKSSPIPVLVVNDLPGFQKDSALTLLKNSPWAVSLGLAAIPAIGGLAANAVIPEGDKGAMSPGLGGYAGDGGLSLPGQSINFGDSEQNYRDYLKATGGMTEQARADMAKVAAAFKTLPTRLQTDIVVHGAPESSKAAIDLAKQYHLTPTEIQTLFQTSNIPDSISAIQKYMRQIGTVPANKTTTFYLNGVSAALQQIATLNNGLDALASHGDHVLPYVHGGTTSANTGGGSSPATGGASRGRGATINIHLGDKVVASVVDDRISTHDDLADERRRAGGN